MAEVDARELVRKELDEHGEPRLADDPNSALADMLNRLSEAGADMSPRQFSEHVVAIQAENGSPPESDESQDGGDPDNGEEEGDTGEGGGDE